jgi:hypothetical protein
MTKFEVVLSEINSHYEANEIILERIFEELNITYNLDCRKKYYHMMKYYEYIYTFETTLEIFTQITENLIS